MKKIILASASPRRKQLLNHIDLTFSVDPSSANEIYSKDLNPTEVVKTLANRKARDVATKHKSALVIGADTIVSFEDSILEKPETHNKAKQMLGRLSNNTHQVITGVHLCKTDSSRSITDSQSFTEITDVTFGSIADDFIDDYVTNGHAMDKAGAYGIQDNFGALFIKNINGDYYNVVGFPLHSFYTAMQSFAPNLLLTNINRP